MFIQLCLALFCIFLNKDVFTLAENNVCSEEIKVGPCRASAIRYGFNSVNSNCEQFIYGGCEGNGNNFNTLKECLETCKPICLKPLEAGNCRALIPRFGFSSEKEKCIEFSYGGCRGNENNFESMADCQAQCEAPDKYGQKVAMEDQ